jgi:hypothetical protein
MNKFLNSPTIFKIAKQKTPDIEIEIKQKMFRHEVANELEGNANIGIELGVAKGIYSKRMLNSGRFKVFLGLISIVIYIILKNIRKP